MVRWGIERHGHSWNYGNPVTSILILICLDWIHNDEMDIAFLEERRLPKSVLCLRDYTFDKFLHDLVAGVTVGLVALPLAMAFAIASGLTPQAGIYCAIVTGFLISLLGGSKTQIGGPTGAFVVVIAGIVATHGVDGLYMCTVRFVECRW